MWINWFYWSYSLLVILGLSLKFPDKGFLDFILEKAVEISFGQVLFTTGMLIMQLFTQRSSSSFLKHVGHDTWEMGQYLHIHRLLWWIKNRLTHVLSLLFLFLKTRACVWCLTIKQRQTLKQKAFILFLVASSAGDCTLNSSGTLGHPALCSQLSHCLLWRHNSLELEAG